jgi:3-mercaptopyruvate sulfurtransferase SseA
VTLAFFVFCAALQAAPQAVPPAQPRYPVDATTGRAIGATEMAPEAVKKALDEGQKVVIVDTRPAQAFEKETLPGAINIPLADLEKRLPDFPKDTILVFT